MNATTAPVVRKRAVTAARPVETAGHGATERADEVQQLLARAATERQRVSARRSAMQQRYEEVQTVRRALKYCASYASLHSTHPILDGNEPGWVIHERRGRLEDWRTYNEEFCARWWEHWHVAAVCVRGYLKAEQVNSEESKNARRSRILVQSKLWEAPSVSAVDGPIAYDALDPRHPAAGIAKHLFGELLSAVDLGQAEAGVRLRLVSARLNLESDRFELGAWFDQLAVALVLPPSPTGRASGDGETPRRTGAKKTRRGRPREHAVLDERVRARLAGAKPSLAMAPVIAEEFGMDVDKIRKVLRRLSAADSRATKPLHQMGVKATN